MNQPLWNQEQAEETLIRFRQATPKIQADERFGCGIFLTQGGKYIAYVYLQQDWTGENELPERYVMAIPDGEEFRIQMEGMVILIGMGIPAKWLPKSATFDELDQQILYVWEQWFKLNPI